MRGRTFIQRATTPGPAPMDHKTRLPWLMILSRYLMRNISVRSSSGNPVVTLHPHSPCPTSSAKTKITTTPGGQAVSEIRIFLYRHHQALGQISLRSLKQRPACSQSPRVFQRCNPFQSPRQYAILPTPQPPNALAYHISIFVSVISHPWPLSPSTLIPSAPCISQQGLRKASFAAKSVQGSSPRAYRTLCLPVLY